jgi:UDP-N-acetylglucosamine 4,6-dehydratase/5-epimerase
MKKTYFITGGTGSFANKFIFDLVKKKLAKKIIVFSRDEFKQMMMKELPHIKNNINLFRFYLGDVRDKNRLDWAMIDDVDTVIHSAALKQVPATEYNPFETVQTNILGTQNVIEVSIKKNIDKVLLISTDKAVSPINLYGSTKLTAEKLFISGNTFKGKKKRCKFAVVRYGNVMGSRGSVIPILLRQNKLNAKFFTITHKSMTRFNITLKDASALVINCLKIIKGGEIFVPKLPSYNIIDLAKAINSKKAIKIIGIRTGEKMHEELISSVEFGNLKAKSNLYIIDNKNEYKNMKNEKLFNSYNSLTNPDYLNINQINTLIKKNQSDFEN